MLKQLPELSVPQWLTDLSESTIKNDPFPLSQVLENSLYYPSSGIDGDPVKYLGGNILSFIYVDYGTSHEESEDALHHPGFCGYELVATREVTKQELTPKGWNPTPPTRSDGEPTRYRDWMQKPFCSWSIFQRDENRTAGHGPSRFSLLYLCADGIAAFQALYLTNSASPKAVAIIQPGTAFGLNWTAFEDPEKIFAKEVLGNPQGRPQVLLYGGIGSRDHYQEPCWPTYSELLCFLEKEDQGSIGVWVGEAQ